MGVPAELLDSAEEFINITGILAKEQTLQHDSINTAAALTNLTITLKALVRQNLNNSGTVRTADVTDFNVRDLQFRRFGCGFDMGKKFFEFGVAHCLHLVFIFFDI